MHKLRIDKLDLVGGGRTVDFDASLCLVRGTITTGKTTLVRLLRALLGSVPSNLPPETGLVRALRGRIVTSHGTWDVFRPLVTTRTAVVEIARWESDGSDELLVEARRLPAASSGHGETETYRDWLLHEIDIPSVEVPRARTQPTSDLVPVTVNDWLNYCIVPGNEIDAAVFGHTDPFRNIKRTAVFELAYGLYDAETAALTADLRSVELRLAVLDEDHAAAARFLSGTPFADLETLDEQLVVVRARLEAIDSGLSEIAQRATSETDSQDARAAIAHEESVVNALRNETSLLDRQVSQLAELLGSLEAQRRRLTRAITAGEWLVDFDFVVCPRCGNEVEENRAPPGDCYLCLQAVRADASPASLLAEQERVLGQVTETQELLDRRVGRREAAAQELQTAVAGLAELHLELNRTTSQFVSQQAEQLTDAATERARAESEVQRLSDYRDLLLKHAETALDRQLLAARRDEILDLLSSQALTGDIAEANIRALEARLLEYLELLDVPVFDIGLTATIDRSTYLPVVSGRSFDELSSQGLEVLVNAAHALAHHTVAIDRSLPMPGLLVLDGLSSNVGHEGFDQARVDRLYRLLVDISQQYGSSLQLIAVDNDVPAFAEEHVVLTLSDADRLIRTPQAEATIPTPDTAG